MFAIIEDMNMEISFEIDSKSSNEINCNNLQFYRTWHVMISKLFEVGAQQDLGIRQEQMKQEAAQLCVGSGEVRVQPQFRTLKWNKMGIGLGRTIGLMALA